MLLLTIIRQYSLPLTHKKMSQILEAIEKAERTRRQGQQQPATDNLYRHLGKAHSL